jgi:hypothetical protein
MIVTLGVLQAVAGLAAGRAPQEVRV